MKPRKYFNIFTILFLTIYNFRYSSSIENDIISHYNYGNHYANGYPLRPLQPPLPIILKIGDYNKLQLTIFMQQIPVKAHSIRIWTEGGNEIRSEDFNADRVVNLQFGKLTTGENKLFASLLTSDLQECSMKLLLEETDQPSASPRWTTTMIDWTHFCMRYPCNLDISWNNTCDSIESHSEVSIPSHQPGDNRWSNELGPSNGRPSIESKKPFTNDNGADSSIHFIDNEKSGLFHGSDDQQPNGNNDMTTVKPFQNIDNSRNRNNDRSTINRHNGNIQSNVNDTNGIPKGTGENNDPTGIPKNNGRVKKPDDIKNTATTQNVSTDDDRNLYLYIGGAVIAMILILLILMCVVLKQKKESKSVSAISKKPAPEPQDLGSNKLNANQLLYADLDLITQPQGGRKPVVEDTPYAEITNVSTALYDQVDLQYSNLCPQVGVTPYAQIEHVGPKIK